MPDQQTASIGDLCRHIEWIDECVQALNILQSMCDLGGSHVDELLKLLQMTSHTAHDLSVASYGASNQLNRLKRYLVNIRDRTMTNVPTELLSDI